MTSIGSSSVRSRTEILVASGEVILSALILLGPLAFGAVETWAVAILQGLILMLGAVVAVHSVQSGEMPPLTVSALAAVVALIGLIQVSNVNGTAAAPSDFVFSASGFYTSRLAFMWACYAVLGAAASFLLCRPAARIRFAWTVFVVGAIIAFVGIVQISQGNTFYYGIRPIKNGIPFGPYTNYNHAASLMAAALCMGLSLFLAPMVTERRRPLGDQLALQTLILGMLALIFFGVLATGSRGGLAAMVVGIGALVGGWVLLGRWRIRTVHKWVAFLFASAAIVGLFFNPGGHRFALSAIAHGAMFRWAIYKSCLSVLFDFPVFGIGLGAVPAALHPYQTVWVGRLLESGHSDILDLLLQVGIVGAAVILYCLLKLVGRCFYECRTEHSGAAMIRLGSMAACTVFLAHGIVESNLRIPANAALIFALLAYASTSNEPKRTKERLESAGLRSYSFGAMAMILAAMLSVPFRAVRGAWVFHHALERSGDESAERLRFAVHLDARPEYQYALAVEYSNAADQASSDRTLLRKALSASSIALESFPYHQSYRGLHAMILSKLGRSKDASAFPI